MTQLFTAADKLRCDEPMADTPLYAVYPVGTVQPLLIGALS